MSDNYDPHEMASDALRLTTPPLHTGIKSFVSDEGVRLLAEELEAALSIADSQQDSEDKIKTLEEEKGELESTIEDMKRKAKEFALEMETA